MDKLKNFRFDELIKSETADKKKICNIPDFDAIENLYLVAEQLQAIRDKFGKGIIVNSGYRCQKLNKAVGGTTNSQHMKGQAADIRPCDMKDLQALYDLIRDNFEYDQLIYERCGSSRWIHFSYKKSGNRHKAFSIG